MIWRTGFEIGMTVIAMSCHILYWREWRINNRLFKELADRIIMDNERIDCMKQQQITNDLLGKKYADECEKTRRLSNELAAAEYRNDKLTSDVLVLGAKLTALQDVQRIRGANNDRT